MNKNLDGFVVYCKENQKTVPYGVVSNDYECKANSTYIPKSLKEYLVKIEDKRFFEHGAIDYKGIVRATYNNIKARRIVEGGSTITQQLARNILKDNTKSFSRKIREIIKAIELESKYSKDEILNLYFDNVYFGKNLRGVRAAGIYYFGKEIENLTQPEILYLLTLLRGPNYYVNNPLKTIKRYEFLNNIFLKENLISNNRHNKNIRTKINVGANRLYNVKSEVIPFITEFTNLKKKTISSTIDIKIQEFVRKFVIDSKYPVSIVAIKKGKVVGFY